MKLAFYFRASGLPSGWLRASSTCFQVSFGVAFAMSFASVSFPSTSDGRCAFRGTLTDVRIRAAPRPLLKDCPNSPIHLGPLCIGNGSAQASQGREFEPRCSPFSRFDNFCHFALWGVREEARREAGAWGGSSAASRHRSDHRAATPRAATHRAANPSRSDLPRSKLPRSDPLSFGGRRSAFWGFCVLGPLTSLTVCNPYMRILEPSGRGVKASSCALLLAPSFFCGHLT